MEIKLVNNLFILKYIINLYANIFRNFRMTFKKIRGCSKTKYVDKEGGGKFVKCPLYLISLIKENVPTGEKGSQNLVHVVFERPPYP